MLIPSVHKTWAPRGQTPIIRHRYQRDKISVISGLSVSPVRQRLGLYWRFLVKKNFTHPDALEFLRHLLHHLRGPVIVLWDKGRIHKGDPVGDVCRRFVGWSDIPAAKVGVHIHAVLWQPIASLGCDDTLAGCNLRGANLAGAYLKGADLSSANLGHAALARANLTGGILAGGDVERVLWSNTICPDGTNSDGNGGTCVGHL